MNRIIYMVIKKNFRIPIWFYHIWNLGKPDDVHTDKQRYDYIRNIVKINHTGKGEVEVHGVENLPDKNDFILFPNHQGLFDVRALMNVCLKPFSIIVKKEASNMILVKQVIKALHGFFIDRQDIKASMKIIMNIPAAKTETSYWRLREVLLKVQICFLKPFYSNE